MKMTGLWRTLDRFAEPATVLAEWRMVLGGEFTEAEPFLRVTQELAESYPCTQPSRCGCHHEVVVHASGRIVAACRCDERECESIPLEPTDLLIHGLNFKKFCGALARALEFEPDASGISSYGSPRIWPVGTYRATHSPVYFCAGPTDEILLVTIEGLITAQREPFILLVPTELHRSAAVQSLLQRQRCAFVPLAGCLKLAGPGTFEVTDSIQPVLERFAAGCVPHGRWESGKRTAEGASGTGNQNGRGPRTDTPIQGARYSLRKGLGTWELIFRGVSAPIEDGRGVQIAAYLLRHPPGERVHAVNLERLVWAQSYGDESTVNRSKEEEAELATHLSIRSEAGGMTQCQDDNQILKREVRELLGIIRDATLPKGERDEAQARLEAISCALAGGGGQTGEATKAAGRLRKAINRLHAQLAGATNEKNEPHPVLREFAEHLRRYLIVPSARFTKSKTSRNKAGVAGTFTYEPPAGVVWED